MKENISVYFKLLKLTILLPYYAWQIRRRTVEELSSMIANTIAYPGWSLAFWQGRKYYKIMLDQYEKKLLEKVNVKKI